MNNISPSPRPVRDPFAVSRNERLQDMAAFALGLEPCRLWHIFCTHGDLPQDTSLERWLRDAPVFLCNFINDYSAQRYATTLDEFLNLIRQFPAATGRERFPSLRLEALFPLIFSDAAADQHAGLALVRLTTGISHTFPPTIREWFEFGRAVGRFFQCLRGPAWHRRYDLLRELHTEACRTDIYGDFCRDIGSLWDEGDRKRDFDPALAEGVSERINDSIDVIYKFLADEPVVILHKDENLLWFCGVAVELSATECHVLTTIAEPRQHVATRRDIQKAAGLHGDPQKVDQFVQQIINKIVEALRKVGPPRYKSSDQETRDWLREQFIIPVRSSGWRLGKLWRQSMV